MLVVGLLVVIACILLAIWSKVDEIHKTLWDLNYTRRRGLHISGERMPAPTGAKSAGGS